MTGAGAGAGLSCSGRTLMTCQPSTPISTRTSMREESL
ncbi:Uncharacterised protein [Mycobacteroides abscessus subsp. abscessus]|nr:Uncharacterised protein [Mycobacteroides abscessus subsp. abscessus]